MYRHFMIYVSRMQMVLGEVGVHKEQRYKKTEKFNCTEKPGKEKTMKINTITLSIIFLLVTLMTCEKLHAQIISESRMLGIPDPFYNAYIKPFKNQKIINAKLTESYYKGSYRDIGRKQAAYILKNNPNYKDDLYKFLHALIENNSPIWNPEAREKQAPIIRARLKEFFPEIIDEIEGFAEVLGISADDALKIYSNYGLAGENSGTLFGNCTLFAIDREKSANGNILIGRSYEFLHSFSEIAITGIKPDGGYSSVGCSQFYLGRVDGINEYGLFIGIASSFSKNKNPDGFLFPIIVRAILDKAKNVEEAIEILNRAPKTEGNNYLIADKSGKAAIVEVVPLRPLSIRWLKDSPEGILVATNHYQNNETQGENVFIMPNSYERVHIIKRLLGDKSRKISKSDISSILSNPRPNGVYWSDYTYFFGTIYSGIYDLEEVSWDLTSGNYKTLITKNDITTAAKTPVAKDIQFINNNPFPLDYIATSSYGVNDIDTFYCTASFLFLASPVPGPFAEFAANYKQSIAGNEKTYGPNLTYSAMLGLTPAFSRFGAKIAFNPIPLLSLEVMPFYYYGWRVYSFVESSGDNAKKVNDNFKNGKNETFTTPGITVNPIIQFGGIITLANKFSYYKFKERVYEYETCLLLNKTVVWTPSLTLLIPYSKNFLWGLLAIENYEFSHNTYNIQAGPMLVFPKIISEVNLMVNASYWFKTSEGKDRINVIVGLIGKFY